MLALAQDRLVSCRCYNQFLYDRGQTATCVVGLFRPGDLEHDCGRFPPVVAFALYTDMDQAMSNLPQHRTVDEKLSHTRSCSGHVVTYALATKGMPPWYH